MNRRPFAALRIGDRASFSKTIAECDVYAFAGITGDFNEVHIDRVAAERGEFKQRVAHGMLGASLISTVLGGQLPGPGTIYMSQSLRFLAPVFIGDTVTAEVEIIELLAEKRRVRLRTVCRNERGQLVADGEALVLAPADPQPADPPLNPTPVSTES
jgi:3-hydroxybutyryl-CoA dehydratase